MTDKLTNFYQFGTPETAINPDNIAPYLGVFEYEDYYMPPVSLAGLTQLLRANHHHGTLPSFKANLLLKQYIKNPIIERETLRRFLIDYNSMGNAYLQLLFNKHGVVVGTKHLPAVNMRVGCEQGFYYLFNQQSYGETEHVFLPDHAVIHLKDYDPNQNIYGVPYWIGVIQSVLLGEDVRLVPRRFFANGAHMGNLFLTTGLSQNDENAVYEALSKNKGVGNFRSQVISLPKGDVDKTFKMIPIGEIGKITEFKRLADLSASDILEAWRIRPELAGMMPEVVGGSGDLFKIMQLHHEFETIPLQQMLEDTINKNLPTNYFLQFKEWNINAV